MEILRAFLYSLAIFAGLTIIALLVAGIMMMMYSIIQRGEKKSQIAAAAKTTAGKVA